ncbi:MAG: formylglycine-generating enzyme family protein, partial [Bacteroidota bacterium]
DTKKSQVRQNIALGILGALLLALLMPFHPQLQTCVGPQLKEGSLVLCLEDYSDSLVYYQYKIGERLKVYDFKGAEDTLSQVLGMAGLEFTDSIVVNDGFYREFFTNVSFVYFNQGITYLNRKFVAGYNAYGTVLEDTLCNQLMQRSKELQPQDSRPLDSAILLQSQSEETDVMRTYRYICGPLLELGLNNSPCLDLILEANALIERKASPNQFQKLIDRVRRTCPQNLDALRAEYDKLVGQTQETPPLSSASTELDTARTGLALEGEERLNLGNSGFLTVKGQVLVPASEVQGQNYTLKINSEPVRTVSTGSTTNRAGERRESFSFILEVPSGQTTRTLSIEVNSDVYEDINDSQELKLDPSGQSEFTLKPIRLVLREERSVNTAPILPDMIYVRGGNFLMGSTNEEVGRGEDEVLHRVRLDDYEIGRYEVTNREYAHFLNANVDREDSLSVWIDLEASNSRISFSGESYSIIEGYDGHPVRYVSWYGAQAYCRWLNETQAGGKTGWRLPSEAQWEYAAAGGVRGYDPKGSRRYMYAGTSNGDSLSYYANYGQNLGTEDRVGAKYPNPLGIHDMSGNVWEWCGDWYGEYQGEGAELQNPSGPTNEYRRVVRGGSWFNVGNDCRVSVRSLNRPADRDRYLGFRVSRYSPR